MPRNDKRHFYPKPDARGGDGLWLYGLHAVRAALANPLRKTKRIVLTARAAEEIGPKLLGRVRQEIADGDTVSRLLPANAVHQGVALQCDPLPGRDLDDVLDAPSDKRRIVVILDQISDPQNTGAILRTAAAFGVAAVVVQDRHSPPESGTLAKAASGALDSVPYIHVVNIARTLEQLGDKGDFWRVALAGDGETSLKDALSEGDVALVLGSGRLRHPQPGWCASAATRAAFVPIDSTIESLNVSNAAACALYEMRRV